MNSEIKTGFLVVADISGYTRFLADTELEHANGIIKDLFDAMVPEFNKSVTISKFMGDAIFAHVENIAYEKSQFMIDFSSRIYGAFADKKELININTDCECNACKHMSELDLKMFLHHGEYGVQEFNGNKELAGSDVNAIFRLMKNNVVETTNIEAYLLITQNALNAMEIDFNEADPLASSETYEHIGELKFLIEDLNSKWKKNKQVKKHYVRADDKLLMDELSIDLCVSPDIAFLMYTKPEWRKQNLHADKIDIFNSGKKTQGEGTELHCHHGKEVFKMQITDWNQGDYISIKHVLPFGVIVHQTNDFVRTKNGCTMKIRFRDVESTNLVSKFLLGKVRRELQKGFPEAFKGLLSGMQEFATKISKDDPSLRVN